MGQATKKGGTRDVAHVSRRTVSPFLATCLCRPYLDPVSVPGQPVSQPDKNTRNLPKNTHFVRDFDTRPPSILNSNH